MPSSGIQLLLKLLCILAMRKVHTNQEHANEKQDIAYKCVLVALTAMLLPRCSLLSR